MGTYFNSTPYQVVNGNIVYATDLNDPFLAIDSGLTSLVGDIRTGDGLKYGADTGAANAYAFDLSPSLTTYETGLEIWLKPANTNTGASTININSLGAKNIKRFGLEDVEAGDIQANYWLHLKYDGTQFQIVSSAGSAEAACSGYATAAAASASDASDSEDAAAASAILAAAAALSLDLPTIGAGDADKILQVKDTEDGYELVAYPSTNDVPIGGEMFWPGDTPPSDFLEEDGSELSKVTYSELFAVIGTDFGETDGAGGVGATHFRLPDPRGRVVRVWDNGAGVDPDAATRTDRGDGTTGDNNGTNQAGCNLAHNHTGTAGSVGNHAHTYSRASASPKWTSGGSGYDPLGTTANTSSAGGHSHTLSINNDGGNEARMINTNRMLIIKYQ